MPEKYGSYCTPPGCLKQALIAAIVGSVAGCGGGSSGGEEIVSVPPVAPARCQTYVVDKDHAEAADSRDGRYRADGGSGPWLTIQHGVDNLEPCDTLQVRAAATPYTETANYAGAILGGVSITQSGESNRPIVIEGYPGERPVVDQQRSDGTVAAGFLLHCVSSVTLRNFEIRNAAEAGVSSALNGCASDNVTIENMEIHDIRGGNLTAAIRLAGVSAARIHNNRLYDIAKLSDDNGPARSMNAAATRGLIIGNNSIDSAGAGIVLAVGDSASLIGTTLKNNDLRRLNNALLATGGTHATLEDTYIHGNLMADAGTAITIGFDNDFSGSTGLSIHNNTFAHIDNSAVGIDGIAAVGLYNNLFFYCLGDYLNAGQRTRFDSIDHNLYWPLNNAGWTLDTTSGIRTYILLSDWSSAYSGEAPAALRADPDTHAVAADPNFIDSNGRNFRIDNDSIATGAGRDGDNIGAYPNDDGVGVSF